MRKILLSLIAISTTSISLANYLLPSGNYSGFLRSAKDTIDNVDANKTNITDDEAYVFIPTLQDINSQNGELSGKIQSMNEIGDCFKGSAKFQARKFGITVNATNVAILNCKFDMSNNKFTGDYSADVPLYGTQTGSFEFILRYPN